MTSSKSCKIKSANIGEIGFRSIWNEKPFHLYNLQILSLIYIVLNFLVSNIFLNSFDIYERGLFVRHIVSKKKV